MYSGRVGLLNIVFIFFTLTNYCDGSQELKSPASDFIRHVIVQPIIHHGRTKLEIFTTRHGNGGHHSEVQVTVPMSGKHWVLDLKLNEDLVTAGHTLQYQERGNTVQLTPDKQDLDLCHYSGSVRGKPNSWVAVSTCHGLSGVIYDGEKMRYIEPAQGSDIRSSHYMYEHSDLNHLSGITNNFNYYLQHKYRARRDVHKRPHKYKVRATSEIQEPYNSNKLSRYVELALVADHRTFLRSGSDVRRVQSRMIEIVNIINSMYTPLNIFIALVGVSVWSEGDQIQLEQNSATTLSNFLAYRKQKLSVHIPNDNAHLLTQQKFEGNVVGKGNVRTMCKSDTSGGVAFDHSTVIGLLAATIAHEMGHNFGMNHDEDNDCECPSGDCIMAAYSAYTVPSHWSSCSLNALTMSFSQGLDHCLRNKPKRLFASSTCGNGFIEPGEECDCGILDSGGINPCHACCHPDTCMLRVNSTCAAGTCCDLTTCSIRSAGTVCRAAKSECDLSEYCTGHSEYCPGDIYKMDTTPCGTQHNQAYCVRGACRSHTDQCRLLWGTTGETGPDPCYNHNVKGDSYGNCGSTRGQYKPCIKEDVLCGRLHCTHLSTELEYGINNLVLTTSRIINKNSRVTTCSAVTIDIGLNEPDLGLVPDGAKCGHEKMCLKQRCVAVSAVRAKLAVRESSVCPSNCSGHGVCNSEGHCHCEAGFAPPLCATPGPGGSFHSGPVTDPRVQKIIMITIYVIFLGIVPFVALLLFLVCYFRQEHHRTSNITSWTTNLNFRDKMFRLQNSSLFYSLRDINFKRKRDISNPAREANGQVCESLDATTKSLLTKPNLSNTRGNNSLPLQSELNKPPTKSTRTFTKEDIEIVSYVNVGPVVVKSTDKNNKPHISIISNVGNNLPHAANIAEAKPNAKTTKDYNQIRNNKINTKKGGLNENELATAIHAIKKPKKTCDNRNTNETKLEINEIKLKPVNKSDKTHNGVKLKPAPAVPRKGFELASDVKLKPVNLGKNTNRVDDIKIESDVKPLLKGTKPSTSPRPGRLREMPGNIVKQGLTSSNDKLNKGHLYR